MAAKEYYFGYGYLMGAHFMEKKEMKFVSRAGASLPGYKMKFLADAGRGDGTCFPTLIRDDSSTVYGALYGLEEGGLNKLDEIVHTSKGYYHRANYTVVLRDTQEKIQATTYIAGEHCHKEGLKPNQGYVKALVEAIDPDIMPEDYIKYLKDFQE